MEKYNIRKLIEEGKCRFFTTQRQEAVDMLNRVGCFCNSRIDGDCFRDYCINTLGWLGVVWCKVEFNNEYNYTPTSGSYNFEIKKPNDYLILDDYINERVVPVNGKYYKDSGFAINYRTRGYSMSELFQIQDKEPICENKCAVILIPYVSKNDIINIKDLKEILK